VGRQVVFKVGFKGGKFSGRKGRSTNADILVEGGERTYGLVVTMVLCEGIKRD
jgi:hypothetical protein